MFLVGREHCLCRCVFCWSVGNPLPEHRLIERRVSAWCSFRNQNEYFHQMKSAKEKEKKKGKARLMCHSLFIFVSWRKSHLTSSFHCRLAAKNPMEVEDRLKYLIVTVMFEILVRCRLMLVVIPHLNKSKQVSEGNSQRLTVPDELEVMAGTAA